MKQLKKWTTISSKTPYETPWLRVVVDTCELPTKEIAEYSYVQRVHGVAVIPMTRDNKIILVQQYRHPIKKIIWQFPAEGIEGDESWVECAQRCLLEETETQSEDLTDLGLFYADPGTVSQDVHWFIARNVQYINNPTFEPKTDLTEDFNVQAFGLDEISELIEKGEICDNWTLAGLALLQLHKIIPQ